MRAASVTQPWGGLIAAGLKPIENRGRPMIKREDFGKPFALHATREIDEAVYPRICEIAPSLFGRASTDEDLARDRVRLGPDTSSLWYRLSRITSAVIAIASVDRVITAVGRDTISGRYIYDPEDLKGLDETARRWLSGRVGYVLRDVIALPTPVACRGWQGFWTLPDDVERAVRAQLSEAA